MSRWVLLHLRVLHARSTHLRSACHLATGSSTRAHIVSAFFLNSLKVLLVLDLFLDILVSLQNLVVLNFSFLQSFVHSELKSLFVSSHLVSLLLHQLWLRSQDFLVSSFFIKICFLSFELTNSALDLMGFLIVLLLCQVSLNSLEVKEFSRCLKGKGEFSFHGTAVVFEFFSVS